MQSTEKTTVLPVEYFLPLNTKYTRRYSVLRRQAYYWYLGILRISMGCVPLILWLHTKYFDGSHTIDTLTYYVYRPSSYCFYCPQSLFAFVDTAQTKYFDMGYWLYCTLLSNCYIIVMILLRFFLHFHFILVFSPISESGTIFIGTLICIACRIASRYWCAFFSLAVFLPFF